MTNNFATKELGDSPVAVIEKTGSIPASEDEHDVDYDEVYSYAEQRKIIHRM